MLSTNVKEARFIKLCYMAGKGKSNEYVMFVFCY